MHYKTMSTEDICRLSVPAAEDAVLFLWATNPKLEDALKAWASHIRRKLFSAPMVTNVASSLRVGSFDHTSKEGKACDSRRS
jgi:N6-adenosine-specific RNA methylase IME4